MKLSVTKSKALVFAFVLCSGTALGFSASAQWQGQNVIDSQWNFSAPENQSLAYTVSLNTAFDTGAVADIDLMDVEAVKSIYEERQYKPIWISKRNDLDDVKEILQVFEDSWTHGLNPESYHVKRIKGLLKDPYKISQPILEIVVTDAVIRYGHDMTGMRINPKSIRQKIDYWRKPQAADITLRKVMVSKNPARALSKMHPHSSLYEALQEELVAISKEKGDFDHLLPLNFGQAYFQPNKRHKTVASLRIRLGVKAREGARNFVYDDSLSSAVMKFQEAHGLEGDGVIGPKTLQILNRTKTDRMKQIIVNLERLRWLEKDKPDRYVMVNIPNQKLWAVENNRTALEMPVVVGKTWRQTKVFKAEITGVRFNPTWTVPLKLKMEDMVPKLKKDPNYLAEKNIELIRGYGKKAVTLDPTVIDWHKMTWKKMGKLRMVQTPGDHNALGRVRVLMPNPYTIYLHDTNHKELFVKNDRTFSSGCIRLSEPRKMADFILKSEGDWNKKRREEMIDAEETVDIETKATMPVYILYQTMWLDEGGELVYGPDVYKHDRKLIKVLADMNAYHLPGPDMPAKLASDLTDVASFQKNSYNR